MTSSRQPIQSESALGLVSTRSFPAIIGVADNMLKASSVRLVGYEKIGSGYCTAVVRGGISDVRLAVDAGVDFAERIGQLVSSTVIPRPLANLEAVLPISGRLAQMAAEQGYSRLSNQAVGLLETRGFPAMVGAADAMLKAAEVYLSGYEIIGDGLCTAVIRGRISDVTVAVEAGMHEADRIGELHSVMVIPRPLEDLEETLPTASCWVEQPIALPISIKETQKELVPQEEKLEMPDLRQLPVAEPQLVQLPEAMQPEVLQFEAMQPEVLQPEVLPPEPQLSDQPEPRSEPIIRAKPFVLPEESID
jgi:carbon dioxide concentrating mechanism protein CcmO